MNYKMIAEYITFKQFLTEKYPSGIISLVSDTFSFWDVLTKIAPLLKEEIMSRQPNALGLAKVVFRPDSGDPADIICGTNSTFRAGVTPQEKGSIEVLWDIFGGTVNEKGYKELDPHVGLIYGDSITLDRAQDILSRLEAKGFASTNVVFGIGSATYQGGLN